MALVNQNALNLFSFATPALIMASKVMTIPRKLSTTRIIVQHLKITTHKLLQEENCPTFQQFLVTIEVQQNFQLGTPPR
jgi:hypothetical protein